MINEVIVLYKIRTTLSYPQYTAIPPSHWNPSIILHVGKIIINAGLDKNHFAQAWQFCIDFTRCLLVLLFMCVNLKLYLFIILKKCHTVEVIGNMEQTFEYFIILGNLSKVYVLCA